MRRVVVTGLGIISSIGNDQNSVLDSLKKGKSGIVFADDYAELGFRSQIKGDIKIDLNEQIDRKQMRIMGSGSAYAYLSMQQAINDSGLSKNEISNLRTGLIAGSGGPSTSNLLNAFDITRQKGPKRIGPYMVPRCMSSTVSACISTFFEIKGLNYSISSACSTSAHCITSGVDAIRYGMQDIIFAGGGEELDWALSGMFDAMTALSSKYNDTPEKASRPYDKTRDGFVISGGGGVLVLEEYEHAKSRGAKVYAELTGYGATSDGYDMVAPSGEGAVRCMKMALSTAKNKIDYINTHGTSTPVGDITELKAVGEVFNDYKPKISSTKSLAGHSLGATSVHEAVYSLIMMKNNFIAASANINDIDEEAKNYPIVTKVEKNVNLNSIMSNSFGFGGTNATLVFEKVK